MKILVPLTALVALTGCSLQAPLPQAPDGYDAIRFQKSVTLYKMMNRYDFQVGSTFIADKRVGDVPVYCGQAAISYQVMHVCVYVPAPDTIGMGWRNTPEDYQKVPPGSFEQIKVKL